MRLFGRFRDDQSANVAVIFSMTLVPVIALGGAAVDYSRASQSSAALQSAVDAAALGAALARNISDQQRVDLARTLFAANRPRGLSALASAGINGQAVTVTATAEVSTAVMKAMRIDKVGVKASATAVKTNDGAPVCVLALSETASGAVSFSGNARFVADGCAVHTNSSHGSALTVQGSASVRAAGFCSVGGAVVTAEVLPKPETGCDRQQDPFRTLAAPPAAGCTYNDVSVKPNETRTLDPGIYCGGLELKGTVTLRTGIYVIKNGPLNVTSQASVGGEGVMFYLTGVGAGFAFNGGGTLNVSASTEGPYAGILMFQDRHANAGITNTLNGNASVTLKGAIYTPTQSVAVSGNGSFGQASPFMPIIADQIRFTGSSTTRADTTVAVAQPLPKSAGGARLTQ